MYTSIPTAHSGPDATVEIFPGLLIQVAARLAQDLQVVACCDLDLKPPLPGVVLVIEKFPGIRQGTCAAAFGFDATTFGRYIDRLVREGYVSRAVPEEDRRAVCLSLTDKGHTAAKVCEAHISELKTELHNRMGTQDWNELTRLLLKFLAANDHPLPKLSSAEIVQIAGAP